MKHGAGVPDGVGGSLEKRGRTARIAVLSWVTQVEVVSSVAAHVG